MGKISYRNKKTVRIVSFVNGFLFWIFSVIYLAVFQGDLLRMMSELLFSLDSPSIPWVVAILISVLLWIVQRATICLFPFYNKFQALSYIPSFLLLAEMTNVDRNIYTGIFYNAQSLFILGTIIVFYIIGIWIKKYIVAMNNDNFSLLPSLNKNILAMTFLCIMTACLGNADEDFHHELGIEIAMKDQDYSRALELGYKSLSSSKELTALRALALMRTNQLGEFFFEYPQYYQTKGLLLEDSLRTTFYTGQKLEDYIGGVRERNEETTPYLHRMATKFPTNKVSYNYYLTALLLNKDLENFVTMMKKYNDLYPGSTKLPKHYTEALIYYNYFHPETSVIVKDEELENKFREFLQFQSDLRKEQGGKINTLMEHNKMRREFGKTYWWYYLYNN